MSISSRHLIPVEHDLGENDTFYIVVFKRLFSLPCFEGQMHQKFLLFLYLKMSHSFFSKNKRFEISISLLHSARNFQKLYVQQINFVLHEVDIFTLKI